MILIYLFLGIGYNLDMARNRVIYQSEALFVSKNIDSTGSGHHAQLKGILDADYSFNIEREDVNQAGQLARIDALVLKSPTVSLDFSYYPLDGYNEKALGFYVQNVNKGDAKEINFMYGQMACNNGQNFYIITSEEGHDLNTTQSLLALSKTSAISIGNANLNNYTFSASVGDFPNVSVSMEGLNIKSSIIRSTVAVGTGYETGNFVYSAAINPAFGSEKSSTSKIPNPTQMIDENCISALRPGDILFNFDSYSNLNSETSPISILQGSDGLSIQNFSIDIPITRTPIERLGSKFAFAKEIDFPIIATLNLSAILNEIQSESLAEILDDNSKKEISISIKNPKTSQNALVFKFKGSQLQDESFYSNIGDNKLVDLSFQIQIGGPTDLCNGIYLSGSYFENLSGQWGRADAINAPLNVGKYFLGNNNKWFFSGNWLNNSFQGTSLLPNQSSNVIMIGPIAALVNLSNIFWVPPDSIDTSRVTDIHGICFISGIYSPTVCGNVTFLADSILI